ncbi:MAG: fasciclin domain-containing protein, partial [Sphingomicrobium sp.]
VDNMKKPEGKADLTRTLTYHILPGTVLAEDIGKAIDNGKGKAQLATMGGEVLTASKDGDKIVLTDAAGGKAAITRADETMSNGVVHHVDTVLMPGKSS